MKSLKSGQIKEAVGFHRTFIRNPLRFHLLSKCWRPLSPPTEALIIYNEYFCKQNIIANIDSIITVGEGHFAQSFT